MVLVYQLFGTGQQGFSSFGQYTGILIGMFKQMTVKFLFQLLYFRCRGTAVAVQAAAGCDESFTFSGGDESFKLFNGHLAFLPLLPL